MTPIPKQVDDKRFFEVLDLCCKKIEEKMGSKPIADWRSADYNNLNSQLGRQTKVYLSENTLKRIFGRLKTPTRYYPQKATRDALAQFIGYRDWQEFELINRFSPLETPAVKATINGDTKAVEATSHNKFTTQRFRFYLSLAILLTVCLTIALLYYTKSEEIAPGEVKLFCENPNGEVPHTAVFKLSHKGTLSEDNKFAIDFMDEGPITPIKVNQEVVQFFKNPGVVHVRLLHHNKAIDTLTVSMQTKGWVANSGNDSLSAFPIAKLKPLPKDSLHVSTSQLDSAGLNLSKPFLIGFSNIHTSDVDGDNFSFSTYLRTEDSRPGVACMQTSILILGSEGRHRVLMVKPSCAAFSEYHFSEVKAMGSSKNLNKMTYDFAKGGNVRLLVKNKKVSLFINNKLMLNSAYNQSIGKILGIKILFNGVGIAKSPQLFDLKTGVSY